MARTVDTQLCDIVAIVGSAGGIAAMEKVLERLPSDLNAAVLIVLHLTPQHPSLLAQILARKTALAVREAADGDVLEPGIVYVAPPDAHLLITADGCLRLERSELVHHVRPSADALLLSIAHEYAGRCLAVILSGTGIDGAAGAAAVHRAGGIVLAQNEATSQHFGMPGAAILAGGVDEVLALDDIGAAVIGFAGATR
jgi:two-component system, chemotaxis family, protein-glutamate methylesterase/glutaminase